jgi:hypothetical protein
MALYLLIFPAVLDRVCPTRAREEGFVARHVVNQPFFIGSLAFSGQMVTVGVGVAHTTTLGGLLFTRSSISLSRPFRNRVKMSWVNIQHRILVGYRSLLLTMEEKSARMGGLAFADSAIPQGKTHPFVVV